MQIKILTTSRIIIILLGIKLNFIQLFNLPRRFENAPIIISVNYIHYSRRCNSFSQKKNVSNTVKFSDHQKNYWGSRLGTGLTTLGTVRLKSFPEKI